MSDAHDAQQVPQSDAPSQRLHDSPMTQTRRVSAGHPISMARPILDSCSQEH